MKNEMVLKSTKYEKMISYFKLVKKIQNANCKWMVIKTYKDIMTKKVSLLFET